MIDQSHIPTADDVVGHLNERLRQRGLAQRVTGIAVLPYVNPMWLANWDVPQLADGVTGNCRLVREGTFASKISFLD